MVSNKIVKYEAFLNDKLRTDLKSTLDRRDKIYSEVAEYLQLSNILEKMSSTEIPQERLKTRVDIGSNFYMKAVVHDACKVIVSVGLNVFIQFTHKEALQFIDIKVIHLNKKAEVLTKQVADISARIKLVMEGLQELQFPKIQN